jgi:hypothetical protein
VSSITVAGGRLILTNAVGSAAAPLGTLSLVPLNTADNAGTVLNLPIGTNSSGITVTTFNLDGTDTTTNIINIESVGPVSGLPLELPLIKYSGSINYQSATTFNVGLGTLPAGYAGYLTNDTASSQIALVLTGARNPVPVMTGINLVSANTLTISGNNGFPNRAYYVLATTNATLPLTSWTAVATNVFAADGSFSFSTTMTAATPDRFFRVQTQ